MYELSKDHEDFRKVVREFATEAVEPHVAQWDRDHHFPVDLVPQLGDLGLFGLVERQLTTSRVLGALLLIGGVALIQFSGAQPPGD